MLLSGGMAKAMQDIVKGALGEMRRYYSRKIVDVLVRVTRTSLDTLRRRFSLECKIRYLFPFMLNYVAQNIFR